ncbi:hypothetical protein R1flu_001230 [Riccia fluitans]|uniref:Uncharacterized protein n=1 Tax=Riccia fluitans TaxID=41844 RepID=A0ABD1Y2S1_9MARC
MKLDPDVADCLKEMKSWSYEDDISDVIPKKVVELSRLVGDLRAIERVTYPFTSFNPGANYSQLSYGSCSSSSGYLVHDWGLLVALLVAARCLSLEDQDLKGVTLSSLSTEAFRYYLTKSKSSDDLWSLEEYCKLLQLLSWCATKDGVYNFQNLACLPTPASAARFLEDGRTVNLFESGSPSPVVDSHGKLIPYAGRKELNDLLPLVDLRSIHPELLVLAVMPLGIINIQLVEDALEFQAVRCSRGLTNYPQLRSSYNWIYHIEPLNSRQLGTTSAIKFEMQDTDPNHEHRWIRTFYANSSMQSYGVYKWVVIPRCSPNSEGYGLNLELNGLEIGFLSLYSGENSSRGGSTVWLSNNERGWSLRISGDCRSASFGQGHSEAEVVWKLPSGKHFQLNSKIEVELNMVDKICSFLYEGSSFVVTFRNPGGVSMYPAVSLPDEGIQITFMLQEGFDQQ